MRQEILRTKNSEEIDSLVEKKFGPLASIELVVPVVVGGVGGFFGSREFEVQVNVPEAGDETVPVLNKTIDRDSIAGLLTEDLTDPGPRPGSRRAAAPMLNTEPLGSQRPPKPSRAVAEPSPGVPPSIPQVMRMVSRDTSSVPLTIYAGLFTDAVDVLGTRVYKAGALNDSAEPVSGEVAFGLGDGSTVKMWAERIRSLKPDHVYAVVDPSRKHEDSAVWVHELGAIITVAGIIAAPYGAKTVTPGTLALLGHPVIKR